MAEPVSYAYAGWQFHPSRYEDIRRQRTVVAGGSGGGSGSGSSLVAALAHDRVSFNDLDDIGERGFVVRARHGAIAISGRTWEKTQQGIGVYLARHGVGSPAKRSAFLHELYLIEN